MRNPSYSLADQMQFDLLQDNHASSAKLCIEQLLSEIKNIEYVANYYCEQVNKMVQDADHIKAMIEEEIKNNAKCKEDIFKIYSKYSAKQPKGKFIWNEERQESVW